VPVRGAAHREAGAGVAGAAVPAALTNSRVWGTEEGTVSAPPQPNPNNRQ